ncbi:isocitrate/isopropylmalate dehydrogenase family protein [Deltaproteobacteria bacterium PRO3]|nr:isocitrate/isopropylmalate dehydrogenase family protein [Deltaproteobacteria bacterium PRO3]
MPKTYPVTLIEGDGIGPEICAEMKKVVAATGVRLEFFPAYAGQTGIEKFNDTLPDQTLKLIKKTRVAIKGPLMTPIAKGFGSINVLLRKKLELYANVRPVRSFPGVSPYPDVDLVIMRENTEDLYSGIEHEIAPGVVESIKVITRTASTRIAKYAFDYAKRNKRKKVTSIHKANIMKLSDGLFLECARQVSKSYPGIEYAEMIVDNACMQLVTRPSQFDVLLLENLYGDIVSDLCAGLVGGLGLVPGGNIGKKYAIFESVHGSAPDIAGKGVANPIAIILTLAMMLDYLGETKAGQAVQAAVTNILKAKKVRTPDLGGKHTTAQMGDAIAAEVERLM